ncbi:MAG: DNA cytosine methyltransferase [Microcoleaceae cyanobacterium]
MGKSTNKLANYEKKADLIGHLNADADQLDQAKLSAIKFEQKPLINTKQKNNSKIITFADLFAGIGGFHFALHQLGCHCVFASEIDQKARETYQYNLREISPNLFISEPPEQIDLFNDDITKINPINIPDHDILCGGFPCQPFSIAGYRQGLEDQGRGDLIFQIVKILQVKKPTAFFLENVKNLYSHNQGKTYQIIEKLLESAGYYVKAKVLNTMEYGNLPQNRERLYIVGFRQKKHWQKFDFPEPAELIIKFTDLLEPKVDDYFYYNNKPLYAQLKTEITKFDTVYQWRRKYVRENKKGVCPTLTANMGTGGHNVPLIRDKKGIRKLTPTECLRLQGFPANFQFPTNMSISHQYKQVGNAVSVTVIENIAQNIIDIL